MLENVAFQRTATRESLGTASFSNCTRLAFDSAALMARPVRLPPGCARLATIPTATGSATPTITIGIEVVACLAANVAGVPCVTNTSTFFATRAAARLARRSGWPSAPLNSISKSRPITHPCSRRPSTSARSKALALTSNECSIGWSTPTRATFFVCCASTTNDVARKAMAQATAHAARTIMMRRSPCDYDVIRVGMRGHSSTPRVALQLLQPVRHSHLSVHRRRGLAMGLCLAAPAAGVEESSEAGMAVGDERPHPELAGKSERGSVVAIGMLPRICGGHGIAENAQGPRLGVTLTGFTGQRHGALRRRERILNPVLHEHIRFAEKREVERQGETTSHPVHEAERVFQHRNAVRRAPQQRVHVREVPRMDGGEVRHVPLPSHPDP